MSTSQDGQTGEELPARLPPALPRRFQFGISTLFWITTATAILCALLFPMPAVVAIPIMLFISVAVLPAVWTTVIIYGSSYQRTFAIGAMFPVSIFLFFGVFMRGFAMFPSGFRADEDVVFRLVLFGFWISSLLVGAVCLGVRRLLERPNQR